MNREILDGNSAAAKAISLCDVSVIAAYPITPQSAMVEELAEIYRHRDENYKFVCVESEHSAISYVTSSELAGARSTTATASVGLAYMHEVLGVTGGCRVPVVMPIVNRALVAPWSLWCDHQDSMAERDSGWLQFYAENAQEVFDCIIMGYRIAESKEILLPMMVCMDGFYVSHAMQKVDMMEAENVKEFIGAFEPKNLFLDVNHPMFINNLTSADEFTEIRFQQESAFRKALTKIPEIMDEFNQKFHREYHMIEAYCLEDAEEVLIGIGSMCGTIRKVVKDLRKKGRKAGMLKILTFRPFPAEQIRTALAGKCRVGVIDRSAGLGQKKGITASEVSAALNGSSTEVVSFIAGLGGRDISEQTIENAFDILQRQEMLPLEKVFLDKKENAMQIREWEE